MVRTSKTAPPPSDVGDDAGDGDDGRCHALRRADDAGEAGGTSRPPPSGIFLSRAECRRYLEVLLAATAVDEADVPGVRRLPPFGTADGAGGPNANGVLGDPMDLSLEEVAPAPAAVPAALDFEQLLEHVRFSYGRFAKAEDAARYLRADSDDRAEKLLASVERRGRLRSRGGDANTDDEVGKNEEEEPAKKRGRPAAGARGSPRKGGAAAASSPSKKSMDESDAKTASTPAKAKTATAYPAKTPRERTPRGAPATPGAKALGIQEKTPRAAWMKNYDKLRALATLSTDDDGNIRPPDVKKAEDPALYAWEKRQRRQYRDMRDEEMGLGDGEFTQGRITTAKIELLEAIGFDWRYVLPAERAVAKSSASSGAGTPVGGKGGGEIATWRMDWESRMDELREYAREERERQARDGGDGPDDAAKVDGDATKEGEDELEKNKDAFEAEREMQQQLEAVEEERRLEAEERLEIEAGDQLEQQEGVEAEQPPQMLQQQHDPNQVMLQEQYDPNQVMLQQHDPNQVMLQQHDPNQAAPVAEPMIAPVDDDAAGGIADVMAAAAVVDDGTGSAAGAGIADVLMAAAAEEAPAVGVVEHPLPAPEEVVPVPIPPVGVPPKPYVDLPPASHPLTPFVNYVLKQSGELAGRRPSRLSHSQAQEFRDVMGYATRNERRRAHEDWRDARKFERMIVELHGFRREHGHTKVPMEPATDLSMWVAQQRAEYRRIRGESAVYEGGEVEEDVQDHRVNKKRGPSRLTPHRIVRLTEAGFAFSVLKSTKRHTFDERFAQLQAFQARHGHLRVPCTDELLGCYVGNLRTAYKMLIEGRGTKYSLTHERAKQLTDIGFMWNIGKVRTAEERAAMAEKGRRTFDEWFEELSLFKHKFGHAVVPQDFPELGVWVHTTRRYYKLMKEGKRSPLTHEQVTRLVDIGFVFDAQYRRGSKLGEDLRKVGGKKRGTTTTA